MDEETQSPYDSLMFLGYIDPGSGFNFLSSAAWLLSGLIAVLAASLAFLRHIFRPFKKFRKPVIIFLVLAVLVSAAIMGVVMSKKALSLDHKVILLGFDGLSPEILEPMMAQGALPNFQRLKEAGLYKRLETSNPPQSPVAWATFATGKNPGEHGIYDFIIRNPKTYQLDLSLASITGDRVKGTLKAEPFWRKTSAARIPTIILGAPLTFPAEKIYGRMLSGMGTPDILGTEGTFTFYTTQSGSPTQNVGGKVFRVQKAPQMTLHLIGPRTSLFGKSEHTRVPFTVRLQEDGVSINHGGRAIQLKPGEWSDWQNAAFGVTPFKKLHGIFKFYLVGIKPDLELYISPIQFDPRRPFFAISHPSGYTKEIARRTGLFHTQGMPVDTWAVNEKRLGTKELIQQCEETLNERKALLELELERFKKGVLFCYFGTTDTIQHMFWRFIDPKHPRYEANAPAADKEMIAAWYQKMDAILGDTMQKISDEDILIVLSDHGFNSFRRAVHVNTWLKNNGYLTLVNPAAQEGETLLKSIDWSRTKAYAIGFGAIYINQRGRERSGIVGQGEETQKLKEEIKNKLKAWQDEKYAEPVVKEVYRSEEIFRGTFAQDAPDLYIGFNIGYRASWQTALGAVPSVLLEDNIKEWSGDHLFDPSLVPGIFLSNKPLKEEPASLQDMSGLILRLLKITE